VTDRPWPNDGVHNVDAQPITETKKQQTELNTLWPPSCKYD